MSIENPNINTTSLKQLVEILKIPYKDWTLKNFIDFCSLSSNCNFSYLINRFSSAYSCPFCFLNQEKKRDCKIKKMFPYSKEFSCFPDNATIQNKLDYLYNQAKDYLENEERIKRVKDIKLSQLDCELILAFSNSTIYQLETFYWDNYIPTELRSSLPDKEKNKYKIITIGIKNSKKDIRFKVKDIYFKDLMYLRTYYFEDLVWLARKILFDEGVKQINEKS